MGLDAIAVSGHDGRSRTARGLMSVAIRGPCRSSAATRVRQQPVRQLEIERLPVGVQDQVEVQPLMLQLAAKRHAVRMLAPIGLIQLDAVPGLLRLLQASC